MPGDPDGPRPHVVLFVCTGNTCRSPLAEAVCKRLLADRLGCGVEELPARGFEVASAGVATWPGLPASLEADAAAHAVGADLSRHRSRPVNPELLNRATDVIAMTAGHAAVLRAKFPSVGPSPVLLGGTEDLEDPIGADAAIYRACADTIRRHLTRFLTEWLGPP
jgi:protein-tyrosine phosphatase